MSLASRVVAMVLIVFVVTTVVLLVALMIRRDAFEDRCDKAGGVAVKSAAGGPLVCIDRGALIEVNS